MRKIGAEEARKQMRGLLDYVEGDGVVFITRNGKPVAKMSKPSVSEQVTLSPSRPTFEQIAEEI